MEAKLKAAIARKVKLDCLATEAERFGGIVKGTWNLERPHARRLITTEVVEENNRGFSGYWLIAEYRVAHD